MTKNYRASAGIMLAPAVALIGIFILLPMLLTVWLSFQDWSTQTPFGTAAFIGLDNFRDIFGSTSIGRDFKGALLNTALYTAMSVALILPLSVALGLMVYQRSVAGGTMLRTVLFSTYMVPMIAVALVWSKLYSPTEGPLNQMLGLIGIGPLPWLSSPEHRAGIDRAAQRVAAGRLFHRACRRRPDADPGQPLRGGDSSKAPTPGSSSAPSRCR